MNGVSLLRGMILAAALCGVANSPNVLAAKARHDVAAQEETHAPARGAARGGSAAKSAAVNINTADAQALADGLAGIGMSKAQLIVAYRKEHGAFASVDKLGDVQGIGKATLDKNRARIVLK